MAKVPTPRETPKYTLTAFSIDYFVIENFKKISKEHNLGQDPIEVAFDIKTRVSFMGELNLIQSSIYIVVNLVKDKINISKVSEAELSFDFTIENFNSFKEGDLHKFPDQFLKHLNNISISTSRGILYEKFSCTPLHTIMMPLVFSNTEPIDQNKLIDK